MPIKKKSIWIKESRIGLLFFFVIGCVVFLPRLLSFSGGSALYEQYYAHALPISFIDLLVIGYFIRLFVITGIFFYQSYKTDKRRSPN